MFLMFSPQVKGSPPATKRSFLERKGLTPAEIEEAFRRVPEEAIATTLPSNTTPQSAAANSQPQIQQVPPQQQYSNELVPAVGGPMQPQPILPTHQPVRWTQVVLGLGVVAISAYSFAALVLPKIKEIYARSVSYIALNLKLQHVCKQWRLRSVLHSIYLLACCMCEPAPSAIVNKDSCSHIPLLSYALPSAECVFPKSRQLARGLEFGIV